MDAAEETGRSRAPRSSIDSSSKGPTPDGVGDGHSPDSSPALPLKNRFASSVVHRAATRTPSPYRAAEAIDKEGYSWPSKGTKMRNGETPAEREARLEKLSSAVKTVLECIGEDPEREGLLKTPMRFAKALMFFTQGYEENLKDIINEAVFEEDHDEMVIVKNIDVFSLCEHHMISIGYIPNRRVLGLSKLARIAEMFSRRLQVQERLTKQVAVALQEILQPQGVAVTMEAS
ncbi:hypothetical protein HK104_009549 [Borealophlyctis nickersoniae]|nr:hypothetical protein HK104_009549 [Borealophlyctis nickersoniae]